MAELIAHTPQHAVLETSGYIGEPTGKIEITKNGEYNVKQYATADVKVPQPSGETVLTENNTTYNVAQYESATVQIPEGEKIVTPTTSQQIVTPTNGLLRKVTVEGVNAQIDPDIQPENIKQGIDILGVQGTLKPPTLTTKQITENGTYLAEDDNADGYSGVAVAVPQAITKLVDGTITEYIDDEVTEIVPYTFYNRTALTVCRAPNVQTIGTLAFAGSNLTGEIIRFPNCQTVEADAFRSMVYNDRNPRRGFFPKLLNIPNPNTFSGGTAWRTITCLVFKQKVTLGTYSAEFFSNRNNANLPIAKLYVPQRYFDWYTTATNWAAGYAAYPNVIRTIEDNIDYLISLGFSREELLREEEA